MSDLELIRLEGFGKELLKHKNKIFPYFANHLLKIKSLKVKNDDVFVVAYPKSGTTWTEEIVWLVENNLDFEKASTVSHTDRVLFLDEKPLDQSEQALSPRVFKTHLTFEYLPDQVETNAKVIYVMRNPKDMLVSFFHFAKWIKGFSFSGKFDAILDLFLQDKIIYGNWCEHVNQFFANSNVLFITFEDLIEEPFETTEKIASYLGKKLSNEQIQSLVEFTSFKQMRKNSSFCFQETDKNSEHNQLDLFFRKGEIGDWVNYFDEQMSSKLENKLKNELNPNILIKYFSSATKKLIN
uniref:Sulfotransferase-like protein 4 n=1 Tax=Brachionus rotundiformis TaxID=96890 RepID=A0A7H9SLQ1_9BILA|nr:sulfotransferase-like protein 4 [Brachionus rotundiformis]